MKPAAAAPLASLGIRVFGRVYHVPVTRAMTVQDTLRGVQSMLGVGLDIAQVGLAGEDGGAPWTEDDWGGMKKAWMKGGRPEAWLVPLVHAG